MRSFSAGIQPPNVWNSNFLPPHLYIILSHQTLGDKPNEMLGIWSDAIYNLISQAFASVLFWPWTNAAKACNLQIYWGLLFCPRAYRLRSTCFILVKKFSRILPLGKKTIWEARQSPYLLVVREHCTSCQIYRAQVLQNKIILHYRLNAVLMLGRCQFVNNPWVCICFGWDFWILSKTTFK